MTQIAEQPLLIEISKLTVINQIIETIYVEDSIGQIEINKTIKEDDFIKNTIVLDYNDYEKLENVIKKNDDIAGVIVEPVLCNMGLIQIGRAHV